MDNEENVESSTRVTVLDVLDLILEQLGGT